MTYIQQRKKIPKAALKAKKYNVFKSNFFHKKSLQKKVKMRLTKERLSQKTTPRQTYLQQYTSNV